MKCTRDGVGALTALAAERRRQLREPAQVLLRALIRRVIVLESRVEKERRGGVVVPDDSARDASCPAREPRGLISHLDKQETHAHGVEWKT